MNHSICFKGHERYVPREGWLDRGLREVRRNPRVFFENYGADALGVEPKMAKSIRYWLKCSGMIDESVRTVIRLTDLGAMILSKDPYFEKAFSLWMLHCNIARNRRLATAWQLFFNEFGDGEFTRQEMKCKMLQLAAQAAEGEKISARSVGHDCDAILCMYTGKQLLPDGQKEGGCSPFWSLGLIRETKLGFAKNQPALQNLPAEVVLYLLAESVPHGGWLSIEELMTAANAPGRILNLKPAVFMKILKQLAYAGKIMLHQTEGLNMMYLPAQTKPEHVLRDYYK